MSARGTFAPVGSTTSRHRMHAELFDSAGDRRHDRGRRAPKRPRVAVGDVARKGGEASAAGGLRPGSSDAARMRHRFRIDGRLLNFHAKSTLMLVSVRRHGVAGEAYATHRIRALPLHELRRCDADGTPAPANGTDFHSHQSCKSSQTGVSVEKRRHSTFRVLRLNATISWPASGLAHSIGKRRASTLAHPLLRDCARAAQPRD